MLSQKISRLALSIVSVNDNSDDRQLLEEAVSTYDSSLQTLWKGGEVMGITIPPALSVMNELFQCNTELWQSFKEMIAIAIKETHDTKTSKDAIDFIRQNNDALLNLSNEITREFERIFSAKNFRLRIILLIMLVCDITIFIIGYLFSLKISKPIKELSEAAKKVGEGDFSRKLEFSSHDEVGTLGKTFNKMIDDIEHSKNALISAKEFTDTILRSMIDPLILVDLEGTIKGINQATNHLLGYTAEELQGKPVGIIFKSKEDAPKKTRLQELTKEGFIRNCKTKSGENIPIGLHTSTMQDLNGKLLGYVCIARDMRQINELILELDTANAKLKNWSKTLEEKVEERTAELNLQRYYLKKAQEIGTIGTWELDVHKNKLYWTDENYRIFGISPGTELTNDDFLNCVHPEDREYVQKEWKAALSAKPYDIEHRIVAGNTIKWIREKAELAFDEKSNCISVIGFSQDITDRKQTEEKLKQHNGCIEVSSAPGKGTTCTLYLPLTDQEVIIIPSEKKEEAKAPTAVITKTKTILLAEDETAVRDIVTKTLEYKGYEVIASEDGEEAIRKYQENKDHIDLLLFDVMMPKKSGKDAYNIIKKQQSDIKIIFMSGYSEDITTNKAILDEGLYFLQKPVTPDRLLQKIGEVLRD